jgi:nucleoside-diphosphate-sugar epimerase
MRIFITGATGWVGSAVAQELIGAGCQVLGLARNDAGAEALARAGVDVQRGELADTEGLAAAARACDGVIHTAFIHDWTNFEASIEADRRAIEALGAALAGSGKPLITTSGTAANAFVAPGRVATEEDAPPAGVPRMASEHATVALAAVGVRASVIRLPPSVHGDGDKGFVPRLVDIAREKGVSAYVGEGLNRWPAVHRFDAARLYRLVVESASGGARYHAVAEEGVPTREIAQIIGRRLDLPVVSKPAEEAAGHFGFLGLFLGLDAPASSTRTRQQMGWAPTGPGLIADLENGRYFEGPGSKYAA